MPETVTNREGRLSREEKLELIEKALFHAKRYQAALPMRKAAGAHGARVRELVEKLEDFAERYAAREG